MASRVQFRSQLAKLRGNIDRGTRAGLFLAANHLKNNAQRLAPVDTGFLQNYITVIVGPGIGTVTAGTREETRELTVAVERGSAVVGSAASYARWVHENLDAYHATGQAKFLEEPARVHARTYAQMIRDELNRSVGPFR